MPKISVIMPVYNGEKYLQKAIDSILNQTFSDFEFIIIDDGCTDLSENIIESYNDNRIRFVKNNINKGLIYTLNYGFSLAQGDYIARMDADDISLPNRFLDQVTFMEKNKDVAACCSNVIYMSENEKNFGKPRTKGKPLPVEWTILFSNPLTHPCMFIRKSIIANDNLEYRETSYISEDYDLWTRIILQHKIVLLEEIGLHYREIANSAFHANMKTAYENSNISNQKLIESLIHKEVPYFHTYLTVFCAKENRAKNFIEVRIILSWLTELSNLLSEKWNWDSNTQKRVRKDYTRIMANYAVTLPKKLLIKNIFAFFPCGICLYAKIAVMTTKYYWKKVFK